MKDDHRATTDPFQWTPQPSAAELVAELVGEFCKHSPAARELAQAMSERTGTRLADWVDHLATPRSDELEARLTAEGFEREDDGAWRHPRGLFPEIRTEGTRGGRLAIKVDSVADFLAAQNLDDSTRIEGDPLNPLRKARLADEGGFELWTIERHGAASIESTSVSPEKSRLAALALEIFRRRRRLFADEAQGFEHAQKLFRAAAQELGSDWACDLFFAAERDFWQRRNRAGQAQKARQDALGLGWANHDHHTYRSSRDHFSRLIATLELMGFECRERFYGGREAGWGAQVLEQPKAGVVIFADVDLSPEEVTGDFAHEPLAEHDRLGTVGLWCKLHGEAFLQAGMHHLECRFNFTAARDQLEPVGVATMKPFTWFPFLKQAFTQGEVWPVAPERIDALLAKRLITPEQAQKFRAEGALGSHLEILERDQGYKGFNQTGISEIIKHTDPRHATTAGA